MKTKVYDYAVNAVLKISWFLDGFLFVQCPAETVWKENSVRVFVEVGILGSQESWPVRLADQSEARNETS